MTSSQRAQGLVIVGLILTALAWRIYELIVAWRSYWETILTFCIAFVAGWLMGNYSLGNKRMKMSPELKKVLIPIGLGIAYAGTFVVLAIQCIMIFGGVGWGYEVIVSHWKIIAWCIGGFMVWLIIGWSVTRKDRMRTGS